MRPRAFLLIGLTICVTGLFRSEATIALAYDTASGWSAEDVGDVGISGSATWVNGGQVIVAGAGRDIWSSTDGFFFVYRPLGDGEIVARVLSEQSTNPYAKAGVDFRQTTQATSAHVILDVKPDGGVEFMTRVSDGAPTAFVAGAITSFPVWLKLTHAGATMIGSISYDGQSWTDVGSTSVQAATGYAGIAVTSHDAGALNTATFDSVTVNAGTTGQVPSPWLVQDVGQVGTPGSAGYSNGVFAVSGEGVDIWGPADAFTFVYQNTSSDSGAFASLVACVTSIHNTNPYAKAGIMVRSSLAATSASVILAVKPGGGIEFMARARDGDPTSFIAGGTVDPSNPVCLQLVVDTQVIGSTTRVTGLIADKGNWATVGTTASVPVNVAGLAVTSHSPGVLNTATFEQVSMSGYWDYRVNRW